MTEFQKKWAERKKRWEKSEQERVGDIYAECVKRGCNQSFLETFDTRMWLFPVEQTKTFLSIPKDGKYSHGTENRLKQWKVFLEVILEKRPNHEKAKEWKKALDLLK